MLCHGEILEVDDVALNSKMFKSAVVAMSQRASNKGEVGRVISEC